MLSVTGVLNTYIFVVHLIAFFAFMQAHHFYLFYGDNETFKSKIAMILNMIISVLPIIGLPYSLCISAYYFDNVLKNMKRLNHKKEN